MEQEHYSIEDLLLNESFQRYALDKSAEDTEYWEYLIKEHADGPAVFNQAKEIVTFIANRKIQPKHPSIRDEVFEKLQKQILAETSSHQKPARKIQLKYDWYAASILVIIGFILLLKPGNHTTTNAFTGLFLEVVVPEGQRSQLILPDGTKVWLNSGTKLKYPTDFMKNSRDVYIDGEAFFNVTHNKDLPFVVHMKENLSVKVFGTEFNVKCYANDKIIETTLVKGKIRLVKEDSNNHIVQEINIKPNEKATYQKSDLTLVVTKLNSVPKSEELATVTPQKVKEVKPVEDIELITAWKDDKLVFHDETFEEIRIKMERWFGMKIAITDDDLKQERFTGKFVNNEAIYQILDIFNRSEPIKYITRNKEIIISRKKR